MSAVPVRAHIRVDNIETHLSSLGTAYRNPPLYLWSVFFKIDGTTVQVDSSLKLQGTATVIGTPGNQGDLPGGFRASPFVDEKTPIPSAMGDYLTTLTPFPVPSLGTSVGGMVVGWVGVLWYQQNTSADVVATGHNALNTALQNALNALISSLGVLNQNVTPAEVGSMEKQINKDVHAAMFSATSVWDMISTFLGDEYQDVVEGTAVTYFSDSQLVASPPQGLPVKYSIVKKEITPPPLYVFTFNGTAVADTSPFSLRRVLTGLGHAPPVGVRKVMGAKVTPSLLAWIEAVR